MELITDAVMARYRELSHKEARDEITTDEIIELRTLETAIDNEDAAWQKKKRMRMCS